MTASLRKELLETKGELLQALMERQMLLDVCKAVKEHLNSPGAWYEQLFKAIDEAEGNTR